MAALGPSEAPVVEVSPLPLGAETLEEQRARRACAERIEVALAEPAAPGAPALAAARAQLFASAKSEPVLFVRAPEYPEDASPAVQSHRRFFQASRHAYDMVRRYLERFRGLPGLARQILLRDGYFYADDPDLAFALVEQVKVHQLFAEPRIWIQRGDRLHYAVRDAKQQYRWEDGPATGQPVRLVLMDRLGVGDPPLTALHRDLRRPHYRLHFEQLEPLHLTERHLVAELRYGEHWSRALFEADGARLDLSCELIRPEDKLAIELARGRSKRQQRVVQGLREVMLEQIEEALPFDEPKTEIGQQDGRLRSSWIWAYRSGQRKYKFNGDEYPVFDGSGRPRVPQVCVDFLTDTLERASGTWWTAEATGRQRQRGLLDLGEMFDRDSLRRAPEFIRIAEDHPEWFDVYEPPPRDRVEMGYKREFYRVLRETAAEYRPGDIVFIRGYTPWDPKKVMHYHSFWVYESDPVTLMPILIAGNAGTPSIRAWESEARRTPFRAIVRRIRPRLEWLESVILPERGWSVEPPMIASGSG